jgi:hypothetical protein
VHYPKVNFALGTAIVLAFIFSTPVAASSVWTEVGDAGELLGTANVAADSGPLTSIEGIFENLGTIPSPIDDIDMYKIQVSDPDNFAVAISANLTGDDDTTLFLLNSIGEQVLVDQSSGGGLIPEFSAGDLSGESPGDYFLAVSLFATGPLFSGEPPTLSSWQRLVFPPVQTGPYTLSLEGASLVGTTATIPVPGAVWLLGSGILALLSFGRRNKP